MMVGQKIYYEDPKAVSSKYQKGAPVVLEVEHLNPGSHVKDELCAS